MASTSSRPFSVLGFRFAGAARDARIEAIDIVLGQERLAGLDLSAFGAERVSPLSGSPRQPSEACRVACCAAMPYAYDPAEWHDFYVMLGGANAALTGLVFVALSIHLRAVLDHPLLKPRAVIALTVLTTQIVIAAIVLAPQPSNLMGVELFILNASFLAVDLRQLPAFTITRASLLSFSIRVLYIWAAVSLIVGTGGGFYVLAFVVVITLARTMASAWALLTALE